MAKGRYGIAIGLPTDLAAEVDGLRRAVGSPQLSRIEPHVTLYPPTSLIDSDFTARLLALRELVAGMEPFELCIDGAGAFKHDLGVLYLAVEPSEELAELEEGVRRVMDAPERRRDFVPHVTVYDNAPLEVAEAGVSLFSGFRASFGVEGVWVLRQDARTAWQRYGELRLEPTRRRAVAGLPATFYRSGGAGDWLSLYGADGPASGVAYPSASVAYGVRGNERLSVAGFRGTELIGTASATVAGALAYLDWIWAAEAERGRGLVSILVDELAFASSERGLRALVAARADSGEEAWERVRGVFKSRGASEFEHPGADQTPMLAYRLSLSRL